MRGLLIVNGFMKNAAFDKMYEALLAAGKRENISLSYMTNDAFCPFIEDFERPDFVLFWDKDVRLAAAFEARGLPVFNGSEAIRLCDDKTLTYQRLWGLVPMPQTIIAPQTFFDYGDAAFLERVGDALSYPYVLKEGCGSFGQQVYLVRSLAQARSLLFKIGVRPVLFQRFISESFARDLRLYMVGGECVAAMERVNNSGDFRANIAGGGHASAYRPHRTEIEIAQHALDELGLTFAGVDLLFSNAGPLLCEVNSNAHFTALCELTHVNPADYIMREIKRKCAAQ